MIPMEFHNSYSKTVVVYVWKAHLWLWNVCVKDRIIIPILQVKAPSSYNLVIMKLALKFHCPQTLGFNYYRHSLLYQRGPWRGMSWIKAESSWMAIGSSKKSDLVLVDVCREKAWKRRLLIIRVGGFCESWFPSVVLELLSGSVPCKKTVKAVERWSGIGHRLAGQWVIILCFQLPSWLV